jgi:membrane protein required for colicin V production
MNVFDGLVYLGLVIAIVTGFNIGMLRSAITILAYLVAMPLAVAAMSLISPRIDGNIASPLTQNSLLFFVIFLIFGMGLGKLARTLLDETLGSDTGIGDRLGGATLGAIRVGLVATTLVLLLDEFVPGDRQPAFLTGSQLRPLFSAAGQRGITSLPADAVAVIDQLKKERRI